MGQATAMVGGGGGGTDSGAAAAADVYFDMKYAANDMSS